MAEAASWESAQKGVNAGVCLISTEAKGGTDIQVYSPVALWCKNACTCHQQWLPEKYSPKATNTMHAAVAQRKKKPYSLDLFVYIIYPSADESK